MIHWICKECEYYKSGECEMPMTCSDEEQVCFKKPRKKVAPLTASDRKVAETHFQLGGGTHIQLNYGEIHFKEPKYEKIVPSEFVEAFNEAERIVEEHAKRIRELDERLLVASVILVYENGISYEEYREVMLNEARELKAISIPMLTKEQVAYINEIRGKR